MIDAFVRIGPLMDPRSYPAWAQRMIEQCFESKRRVVEHEIYQRLSEGTLSKQTIRQYLIGGWPVVEQFSLYMAHNLTKTRYGRHQGEDMARRWLMRGAGRSARAELPERLVLARVQHRVAGDRHGGDQLRHRGRHRRVVSAGLSRHALCPRIHRAR